MDSSHPELVLTPQKKEILAVARNLLAQYGYDGLSIRELAHQAGLATATIYHHFRDKEDILLHVLEYDAISANQRHSAIVESSLPVVEKLHVLLRSHLEMLHENRLIALSTVQRLKTMEHHIPWFAERILSLLLQPLVAVFEQGKAQGLFRPIDSHKTAITTLGMMHSLCAFCLAMNREPTSEEMVDHIADIVLHGVTVQTAK